MRSSFQGFTLNAIHLSYHTSLRSSSNNEPRYPSLRVVLFCSICTAVLSTANRANVRSERSPYSPTFLPPNKQKGLCKCSYQSFEGVSTHAIKLWRFAPTSQDKVPPRANITLNTFLTVFPRTGKFEKPAERIEYELMIHLKVHLQIPCYDFFFL